ncbi:hypothetical protein FACS189434_09290 [Bacteroidia bacterium]|nr:hypothetical protein FACS189434_09290 [Bacteroidia bacterium]
METKNISIKKLLPNSGQIDGLPANPRFIKDENFDKLVKSLQESPEMLNLRELLVFPFGGQYVIIGGNMRYRAAVELGYTELPCKIIAPETPTETLKAYAIKDNASFGAWDYDMLSNEWDTAELDDWGVDVWQNNDDGMPEELDGVDLTPNDLEKLKGDDETLTDRIIITFPHEKKGELERLLNIKINKVVFTLDELQKQ